MAKAGTKQAVNPYRIWLEARVGKVLDDVPSPLGAWLAGQLVAVHDDGLTVKYTVRPEMANPAQVLHGGMAAAMMDELVGTTIFAFSGGHYHASINLTVDFLGPARVGDIVTARSLIMRMGSRVVNATCLLGDAQGNTIAHATSNLIIAEPNSR